MISAKDLRNAKFNSEAQGYSRSEVNNIIEQAAQSLDAYANENKELYHKLEVLAAKIEEYRSEEDSIKTALITAQKMADKIEQETKEKNEKLKADAEAQVKLAHAEAKASAERAVNEARDYAANLIKTKNDEAAAIVAEAEKKANSAINSSKIVAKDILDQAKQISDDLIATSREENEAYTVLNKALKKDAAEFIEKLKALYAEQLEALNGAKLETSTADEKREIEELNEQRNSLVSEMEEIKEAIPEEVTIEAPEPPVVEEPVYEAPEAPAAPVAEEEPEQIELIPEEPVKEVEPEAAKAAVEAFSADEITPVDTSAGNYQEITEEPEMEETPHAEEEQPFESYFNISKNDAHLDKTQTISLVPPEDFNVDEDDGTKHKGFFKRKK